VYKGLLKSFKPKGPSIKGVRSQGRDVCLVRTFCRQGGEGGSSDADVRTFRRIKHRIFRNFWCVRTDKEGWASADTLRTRGMGGQFFAILCGRHLWTAPNLKKDSQGRLFNVLFFHIYLFIVITQKFTFLSLFVLHLQKI